MSALTSPPNLDFAEDDYFAPPVPETVADTGLDSSTLEQLIIKHLYFRGDTVGRALARAIGLNFSVIDGILEFFKHQHLVDVKKSYGIGNISSTFALSESGRRLALEYLEKNTYAGVAPVPLDQYVTAVLAQRWTKNWLRKDALHAAYRHMILQPDTLRRLGPAVSAGKSFLVYGQPGNGKTYLAEALAELDPNPIFIPYTIECQGQLIQVFDPIYHLKMEEDEVESIALTPEDTYDRRWARCRRPFIMTGGELTLDMLDLSYSETSRTYDAPFQLKANNGIYLIDDFGRQKVSPAEVLNRWIVPMERRVDFLSLRTGGKMRAPFEAFLVFSTNLQPENLGDEAFLRRIQYKMHIASPTEAEFRAIFDQVAGKNELAYDPEVLDDLICSRYEATGKPMRRCHPRDIISHAIDYINFEEMDRELTADVLDHAFESCFVEPVVED